MFVIDTQFKLALFGTFMLVVGMIIGAWLL